MYPNYSQTTSQRRQKRCTDGSARGREHGPGLCKPYARGSLRLLKRGPGGRQSSIVSPRAHAFGVDSGEGDAGPAPRHTDLAAGQGSRRPLPGAIYAAAPPILRGETGFSWISSALSRSRLRAWARDLRGWQGDATRAYPGDTFRSVNAARRGEDRPGTKNLAVTEHSSLWRPGPWCPRG